MFVTVRDVFDEFLGAESKGNRGARGIESPEEGGHEEELGVVAMGWLVDEEGGRKGTTGWWWADVLISTEEASTPYLRFSNTPITLASSAFRAAADSAKRQHIGMLGRPVPVNLTLRATSVTSGGKSFLIKPLLRIPSWNTLSASLGIE